MLQLIQSLPVQRDKDGSWTHPGIPDFGEDIKAYSEWMAEQGLETSASWLESESPEHPVYISYFEGEEASFADWEPSSPAGADWFTLSVHETDDGPVWVWARRIEQSGGAQ